MQADPYPFSGGLEGSSASVVPSREQSPSSDYGSRRGQCKWGRCHHFGGLFLLALAEALWLGLGIGHGGDTRVHTPPVVHKRSPQRLGPTFVHTCPAHKAAVCAARQGPRPQPSCGGTPVARGHVCVLEEVCMPELTGASQRQWPLWTVGA